MAPRILLFGATGYIGGDALFTLAQAHPDYEIACLVRNSDKGAQVASQYSSVRLVYGDLDDTELLEQEATKVDIVMNCANSDHEAAIKALLKGLRAREAGQPGFYIHTSGSTLLSSPDLDRKTYGEASTKIYDDWEGIGEITSVPEHAPHRSADKIIIDSDGPDLKTAIVLPPIIYGQGRGPNNQRSHQVPDMARCTLQRKSGFQVGAGKNSMPTVHVYDLSDCYLKVVETAVQGGGKATWGKEGYYFTENGEHAWGHIAKAVTTAAHKQGLIPSDEVATIAEKVADGMIPRGAVLWGANTRYRALRARKLLDWSPKEKSLDHYIPEAVSIEAKNLGLVPGHAAKVAG